MKYKDDEIIVEGIVMIETPYKKQKAHNTILYPYLNVLAAVNSGGGPNEYNTPFNQFILGTDTSTPTGAMTAGLASPLSGTQVNAQTNVGATANSWYVQCSYIYTGSYFPSPVTIGEIAILGINNSTNVQAFTRLAVADGTFTAVSVNASTPLSIQWNIYFEFGA